MYPLMSDKLDLLNIFNSLIDLSIAYLGVEIPLNFYEKSSFFESSFKEGSIDLLSLCIFDSLCNFFSDRIGFKQASRMFFGSTCE